MKACDAASGCIGFNTNGWLKTKCPNMEIMRDVDTYLLSSSSFLFLHSFIVPVPTGEEPDVLLWPMPLNYKSGNDTIPIDPINIRFESNFQIPELTDAILR